MRVTPSMLKPNAEVVNEWEVAHTAFVNRLAEILVRHYHLLIRKEHDLQGFSQESIGVHREAIETARLPDGDFDYSEELEKTNTTVSGSSSRDEEGGHHALVSPWFPVNSYLRCTVLSLH